MERLSKEEAQFIINAADAYNRAQGVQVAGMALVVCQKMQAHIKLLEQPPAVAEPVKAEG